MVSFRQSRKYDCETPNAKPFRAIPPATFEEQMADWRTCWFSRVKPDWVPSRVRLLQDVHSDPSRFHSASCAVAGDYDCRSNVFGAISVIADDGKPLGVRPFECEVLAFQVNRKKLISESQELPQ